MKKIDGRSKEARAIKAKHARESRACQHEAELDTISHEIPSIIHGHVKHVNIQEAYAIRDILARAPREELYRIANHPDDNPQYALAKTVAQQLLDVEKLESHAKGFRSSTNDPGIIHGHLNKYKLIDTLTTQKTVLQEAHELIYGAREAEYGDPKENLSNIAQQWNVYLSQKYGAAGVIVDAVDVCWMMTLLKMCREYGGGKRDSLSDAAGYIGLIERVRG